MTPSGVARWAFGVSLALILGCLAVLWQTRRIPAGTFEPLGSAPVPQATALLIIALSVVVGLGARRRMRGPETGDPPAPPRRLDAAAVAGLTIAYVMVMDWGALDFAPLTALYLFATIGSLIRFRPRGLVTAAIIAVVMGWGCAYVFTRVFVVDLPGL